jgi:hypothetical protein
MEQPLRYWFAAKRYGWGWGLPLTWEGWVVYALWLSAFLAGIPLLHAREHPLAYVGFFLAMSLVLVVICYKKGEPPRWRWGD